MGRSQIKYRASRGRGQGESARGGRGGASGSGRPKRGGGGRALGSNAFRYEEREDGADEVDDDDAIDASSSTMRRQFFAGEQNYRDMGDTKESYFRTKAMQRWEAEDDDDGDNETQVASSTVGVMDFTWISEQLAAVQPSLRYQIDLKYCGDFAFDQPVCDEHCEPETAEDLSAAAPSASSEAEPPLPAPTPSASALDDLLALSSSATHSTRTLTTPVPAVLSSAPTVAAVPFVGGADENLEDWLDDVLDM